MWVLQDPSAGWICQDFNSIFLWVCLAEEGHEVKMFTLYQGKFQTERSCVFSSVRQWLGSWKTVYPNVQKLGGDL